MYQIRSDIGDSHDDQILKIALELVKFGESGHTVGSNETQIYQEVTQGLGQGHDYHRHHNHHHDLAQCPPASR